MKYDYHIRVPQWGAGTTHRWPKAEYGLRGFGIAPHRLKNLMILKVGGDIYETSRKDIMEFMNKYPHSRDCKQGITLYVVPIAIMKLIESAPVKKILKTKKKPKPKENKPLTLF